METKIINGQPQISPTFGNRVVTYDGLVDFLEMLKNEIPKMGVNNYISNNTLCGFILGADNKIEGGEFCFIFGKNNNGKDVSNAYGFGNNLTLTNNAVWLGQYNFKDDDNLLDVIFGIGKGDSNVRSNSLIITKNNVIAINPGADSFSNSANDIKNSIFINSKGIGQGDLSNITNSIFIGQRQETTNSNLQNTVIIGSNAAQGLQNSFLLGAGHKMQIQKAHSGEEEYTPFQVFAFGRNLSVPNTALKSFYADQADYPIFLMGTGIYDRDGNEQENWTPYAMVVGNKNEQRNVFTLDYQGSINALSLNVEYLTVSNTAFLPADFTLSMKNQLSPVNKRFGYWYTEEGGLLQINKYDQNMPISGAFSIPTIIEFYAGNRNNAQQKAIINADTFNADTEISTNKISADEMSMRIFEYSATNSNTINCTITDVPTFWWARIKYTFDKIDYVHSTDILNKTYYNITAENCILVATTRTANSTAGSICSVFQGSSEWATTEREDNLIKFTGEIKCSVQADAITLTLQSSTLKCGSETIHTFINQIPSSIEVSIMPFYGHKGE